jgi:hypothetical protein
MAKFKSFRSGGGVQSRAQELAVEVVKDSYN